VSRYAGAVLEQLNRVFSQGTIVGLTEGKLLERFVAEGDEASFAALVTRHGPMVLAVCRRILRDEHAVEDAFQATFLILVRRAGAIKNGELVGHWLHGVAHRVAVRARAQAAYRRVHETNGLDASELGGQCASDDVGRRDMRSILDEELARLTNSLRSPLVLCYLEGLTYDEAAAQLRWPVGTVRSRMTRARDLLRRRLGRRGFTTDGAVLSTALAHQPVPLALINSTVRASLAFATKQATAAGVASAAATALARGVLHTMMISKAKVLGTAALAGVLALGGVRTLARQFGATSAPEPAPAAPAANDRQTTLLRSVDRIDRLLEDDVRRNRDLQTELRALRNEIAALTSADPKPDGTGRSTTPPERTSVDARSTERAQNASDKPKPAGATLTGQEQGEKPGGPLAQGPVHYRNDQSLLIVSPLGDRVGLYNIQTHKTESLTLCDVAGKKRMVVPNFNMPIMALSIRGEQVSRIAVAINEHWYPQDLREPAKSAAPIIGNQMAAYVLGRYVYAFGAAGAPGWAVLELPKGSTPVVSVDSDGLRVSQGSHIYLFKNRSPKWTDIDANAILDAPPSKELEAGKK
jgi:RNA polymerase sigma factor (sigma-70 family)